MTPKVSISESPHDRVWDCWTYLFRCTKFDGVALVNSYGDWWWCLETCSINTAKHSELRRVRRWLHAEISTSRYTSVLQELRLVTTSVYLVQNEFMQECKSHGSLLRYPSATFALQISDENCTICEIKSSMSFRNLQSDFVKLDRRTQHT